MIKQSKDTNKTINLKNMVKIRLIKRCETENTLLLFVELKIGRKNHKIRLTK